MFENPYLNAAVFAVCGFVAAFVVAYAVKSRKKGAAFSPFFAALFFGLFSGGLALALSFAREAGAVLVPFLQWARVREIGYTAVWMHFAKGLLPFVPAGFVLSKFLKKCDKLGKAAVFSLAAAGVAAAVSPVVSGFNADVVVGAFLGMLVGFGLFSFIKLFFARMRFFQEPKMSRKTHLAALSVVLAVYMACIALIVVDSGGEFEKLNIFTPDNPLPGRIAVEADLNAERGSGMTYQTVRTDAGAGAERVAAAFGMAGSAQAVDGNDLSRRARVTDGGKNVDYYVTGEWKFADEGFVSSQPNELLPLAEYERLALDVTKNGSLPFGEYVVDEVSAGQKKDAEGNAAGTVSVYLLAVGAQGTVQGSCEVTVVFWYDGTLSSVDKYNADFAEYKSVPLISQQEAWERALLGEGAHTLWSSADSAVIHSVEPAYWLEEIKGFLQPIWMFSGTAVTADGGRTEFQVFVPAMVY